MNLRERLRKWALRRLAGIESTTIINAGQPCVLHVQLPAGASQYWIDCVLEDMSRVFDHETGIGLPVAVVVANSTIGIRHYDEAGMRRKGWMRADD